MRKNLPVTTVERLLEDSKSIVSKTDLQGNITYVNPYFIEISGFTEEELIGAPQNIVRHPDMPREAFADLWATIKAGLPWNGLVKNRCKNGDFYWVQANVTPVRENGQTVGYMSVRTRPSREQVQATDAVYRRFSAGQAGGLRIRRGAAVRGGFAGWLLNLRNISIARRLGLVMAVLALMFGTGGLIAGHAVQTAGANPYPVWAGTVAGIALLLGSWAMLHAAIVAPLKQAISTVHGLAGGDLNLQVDTSRRGDMGLLLQALQQLNVNLRSIIGDVRRNVESIAVSTQEIASGNLDLSGRTESQASSLEETASSVEQFAATVRQNADSAANADRQAQSASDIANRGSESVRRMGMTMEEISTASNKIVDIIGLIDGISFQTNILALNAAVEAARAGEQGRGFAVVAAEVRTLAQRSAAAAKDIKTLIDDSGSKVESGNLLVRETAHAMDEIRSAVQGMAVTMNEITMASREQSGGIEQLNQSINSIDETTQQNAALVEQAAAAAENLRDQAYRLSQAVSVFKIGDGAPPQRQIATTSVPALPMAVPRLARP
ncbi:MULTISPECIES: PAS domain-containing methyl-accepting chemotaxis protein [unclassified Herbaspirillum]|uniref:methyl-accepting chemotaxis protein n=1 Tax=unclassified Herbaspirillum TaxID=2624150 RepID=UPI0011502255|nr:MULTISPECIES: PAS domain-containing methyl-accepting chemotaxis protein [unclassified Herbaspirillum]MBB5392496.1 aerotaxis receptor [Herbaspirillum sp. SJZ102]TQK06135.1 methyl-accepting chemotaxis sensory transducer with Pas/Pac sensor [Herbaspirillum sp. SJZ130]TQK12387.1 methyl-accepting chemotaxis sensory transducer with Pas/Pac sensor [Herbaspirillum sp. SJZ106]